jgi:DNA-directed RNA polymerase specialized sigma24 family protein
MTMVDPRPSLTQAINSPAFLAVLPRLVAYAARRLRRVGWAEGVDHLPSAAEAEEVVNDALVSCLSGDRVWPRELALETFLRGVIRSQVSHQRRNATHWQGTSLEDMIDAAAPSSRRGERLDAGRLLISIEQAIEPDPEMRALYTAIVDRAGKRADLAAALGWTPEHVKAVRARMNWRLAALGLHDGDEDERAPRDRSPREAPAPRRSPRRRAAR